MGGASASIGRRLHSVSRRAQQRNEPSGACPGYPRGLDFGLMAKRDAIPRGEPRRHPSVAWLADPRRWRALAAFTLAVGLAWTVVSAVPQEAVPGRSTAAPREGFLAPDFRLTLLGGGEVALSELRGQVVIVNLWASWCPPCRAEMPALQEAYEAYHDRGLEILAVNTTYQDSQAAAAGFVQEYGLTFPVPLDQSGEVSRSYLLRALPTSFFIDRDGVIQTVVIGGPMSRTTIRTTVERLLGDE